MCSTRNNASIRGRAHPARGMRHTKLRMLTAVEVCSGVCGTRGSSVRTLYPLKHIDIQCVLPEIMHPSEVGLTPLAVCVIQNLGCLQQLRFVLGFAGLAVAVYVHCIP